MMIRELIAQNGLFDSPKNFIKKILFLLFNEDFRMNETALQDAQN